ncbi:MAG: hypothetical protein WD552_00710 [Candidatus Paceibacterota bacterium]
MEISKDGALFEFGEAKAIIASRGREKFTSVNLFVTDSPYPHHITKPPANVGGFGGFVISGMVVGRIELGRSRENSSFLVKESSKAKPSVGNRGFLKRSEATSEIA